MFATSAVLLLLLVAAVVLGGHAYGVQRRAQQQAAALQERQDAELVAARDRTLDAAYRTYHELVVLRSALDGVADPATQAPYERRSEYAFWSQARDRSLQRLAGVSQPFDDDLASPAPRWPDLDRAAQAGLDRVTVGQSYLGALYGSPPSPQLWLDRAAVRGAVQRDVRAIAEAMAPLCVAAQPFDRDRAADCYDIQADLPPSG